MGGGRGQKRGEEVRATGRSAVGNGGALKDEEWMNSFRLSGDYARALGGMLSSSRMPVSVDTKRRSTASWESAYDSQCLDRSLLSWISIRTTVAHALPMLAIVNVVPQPPSTLLIALRFDADILHDSHHDNISWRRQLLNTVKQL